MNRAGFGIIGLFMIGMAPRASALQRRSGPDTSTSDFMVGRVHVILRHSSANDVVAANVYLLGGADQLTEKTAGVEVLMLAASGEGTRQFPRPALRAITARTGATISIVPSADWTMFALLTLRQAFDSSWAVFADRLVAPQLDAAAVERTRQQMLVGARQADLDPDIAVRNLANGLLYANHPYRLDLGGTIGSLTALSAKDVQDYHRTQVIQTRLLVVVVGNIDRATLEGAIHRTLATLPVGTYRWVPPPPLVPAPARVAVLSRDLPTNYILGYYVGPRAGTADYAALRIATAVLSGRMFAEVRSRDHLAYAVDAPFLDRAISAGGFYVTTTDPSAALNAMANQVRLLQTTVVDQDGLHALIGQFITDYFLKNETNADQASFLAHAEVYDGSYRSAAQFVARLRAVTPQDIERVAVQYMHGTRFGFVGDTTKVPMVMRTDF